jgi:hypothetical protein
MPQRFSFALESLEVRVLGYALGVNAARFPLVLPDLELDPERQQQAVQQVARNLERRRLLTRGRVHPQVQTAFALFGAHRASVALCGIDHDGAHFGALGMTDFRQSIVITQIAETAEIEVELLPDEDWIATLAKVLPGIRAATGHELSLDIRQAERHSAFAEKRRTDVERDERETTSFDQLAVQTMVRPPRNPFHGRDRTDRELLDQVMARDRWGSGRFVAAGRNRAGETAQAQPVLWLDTDLGRYLVHTRARDGDSDTVTYRPSSSAEVAGAITAAVRSVT